MLKQLFRNFALKKNASAVPTGFIPISGVKTAVVFIDVEDPSFDVCKQDILSYFRSRGVKAEIFFLELSKLGSGERLITSITNTILKKDILWYGCPSQEKTNLLKSCEHELFISLVRKDVFAMHYLARCSGAKFKVGLVDDSVYDLVLDSGAMSEADSFREIVRYLEKIV